MRPLLAPPPRRILPLWVALPLAAAGGAALDHGFPALDVWPFAIVGVAAILLALAGRGYWSGVLVGLVGGGVFWGLHISWLTLYLGPVPWAALAGLQAIFFALSAGLMAVISTRGYRVWLGPLGRIVGIPALLAALWIGRETITNVWPYGGFAWGRLALSQSTGPLAGLAAWIGFAGLGFVVAFLGAVLAQAVREVSVPVTARVTAVAGFAIVALVFPAWPAPTEGTTRIAAVQGDSDAGLFSRSYKGQILEDHTSATLPILDQRVDMVVWPENGVDIDPTRNAQSAAVLDYLSRTMDAPFIVGTITNPSQDVFYNSSLLWKAGEGATQIYDKVHPVPFAEYMPDRAFWRALAPDLVDLVSRDYSIGTRPNVFDVDGVLAGIAICFDISDDALTNRMIDGGAQVILGQTNNADFGRTDESVQQLAIARLRAIETGRSVVNISTVGTSAIIGPNGSTIDSLTWFEPGAMVDEVPLSSTTTPALVWARDLGWYFLAVGLIGAVSFVLRTREHRRRSR
ncbi:MULTISPECIES: apolipoprotein N-acyltransferase [unclassified Rathayibacter]|uniref:apolipoprotein N-acyltransferase n=1 Tax=unclassified Rathayibacter TaxID=2609250 RepID=UPI00188D4103|nr:MULTISPECIES: apolipoprotein N-acyltransferase [unclassified Rathayibacter]MBF4462329.1 apolipoprotein N-acyltransferase [Rathayibacter sp. VKM Ac-2879]MBF4503628.1 apolipoprotein N-acyltransferase [Rathayibacter sp. VKM Ac-2878]